MQKGFKWLSKGVVGFAQAKDFHSAFAVNF
jgi:hypothetical protein